MRVLLTTDGSDDARAATAWLTQLPLPAGSRVRIVSAVSLPPSALDLPTVRDLHASMREEARRTAEAARSVLAARFPDAEIQLPEDDVRVAISVQTPAPADPQLLRQSSRQVARAVRSALLEDRR